MVRKKIRTYASKEKESSSRGSKTSDFSGRNSFIHDPVEDIIAQYREQPLDVAMKAFAKFHEERRLEGQAPDIQKKTIGENNKESINRSDIIIQRSFISFAVKMGAKQASKGMLKNYIKTQIKTKNKKRISLYTFRKNLPRDHQTIIKVKRCRYVEKIH